MTISPIIPSDQVAETLFLRADKPPQRLSLRADVVRLGVLGIAALALLIYGFLVPSLTSRRAPFARASREIRRAARDADPLLGYRRALRVLHRAFDETAGRRVFADDLEAFLAEQPRFADIRQSAATFMTMSQREFFSNHVSTAAPDFSWLLEFARACRAREREPR